MGAQPFQADFSQYGTLVMDSWLKSLWEKTDRFGISVSVDLGEILLPRENDKWIMSAFVDNGHCTAELECLNRVRIHQQVLFVSGVLDSSGRASPDGVQTMVNVFVPPAIASSKRLQTLEECIANDSDTLSRTTTAQRTQHLGLEIRGE